MRGYILCLNIKRLISSNESGFEAQPGTEKVKIFLLGIKKARNHAG
jgi:hypothetical protein